MNEPTGLRVFLGFFAAWLASVALGFALGCVYAVRMQVGHVPDFLRAAVSGNSDALGASVFVGTTVAIASAGIALLAALFIGLPLYLALRKSRAVSRGLFALAGLGIGVITTGILLTLQHLYQDFPEAESWFEAIAMIVAGPIATLTFWAVVHPGHSDRHAANPGV